MKDANTLVDTASNNKNSIASSTDSALNNSDSFAGSADSALNNSNSFAGSADNALSNVSTSVSIDTALGNTDTIIKSMLFRYLGAFGPASVKDMQAWSGMTRLKSYIDEWKSELRIYEDESGIKLYDLPDATLPSEDTPAPPRFLSEFDNMLISFNDRTRIMAPSYKPRVITKNGLVHSTFLTDGFVRGIWTIEKDKDAATLRLKPFEPLHEADVESLRDEGARLLEFAVPNVQHRFSIDPVS